jgi:hypothetical protein
MQLQDHTGTRSSPGPRAEEERRRTDPPEPSRQAVPAYAAAAKRSLESVAGDAERFAAEELPALRRLLSERIRAQEMQAVEAAGNQTEEVNGRCRTVARELEVIAGSLWTPLQRAEARREAVSRVLEEISMRLREAVNATVNGLLGETEESEELRTRNDQVVQQFCMHCNDPPHLLRSHSRSLAPSLCLSLFLFPSGLA